MADDLRLKVSYGDYDKQCSVLQEKMSTLEAIAQEYTQLQMDAHKVFGDGDTNLEQLRANVQKNIEAVNAQHEMLAKSWQMLQQQSEQLSQQTDAIGSLLDQAGQTAKTAFNTIKIIGDMVN